jgi:tetratricopeptide (TPR) repeat protein
MADQQNTTVEQYVAQHQQLAQQLRNSTTIQETIATLEPVQSLPKEEQIAFLKALSKQNSVDAADIVQAFFTLSDNKEVRKEARRRLVQLEGKDIYAEWAPPAEPMLSNAIAQLTGSEETTDDALLAQFQSIFEGADNLFSGPEYLSVVENFLESWAEGNYQAASNYLADESPLLEGLSREAWIASREQWAATAQPSELRITFIDPLQDENGEDLPIIDVGWSIDINELPETTLAELPLTTILFKEIGRRWFWTRFTVVQNGETWQIQEMSDEASHAFQLPQEELEQRITEIDAQIEEQTAKIAAEVEEEEEAEEEEEEEEEAFVVDEEEEEEEEEEENALADMFANVGAMYRLAVQGLHYTDALIARAPQENAERYMRAFNLAGTLNETERSAVYVQQLAEHIPSERGLALRNLAYSYLLLANQAHENDDHELEDRYMKLVEPTARQAVAADETPQNLILLASILVQEEDRLDEAESLLRQAEKGPLSQDDSIEVETGLAEIAMQRDNAEIALHHYQNLAHLTPDDAQVWFRIGYVQDQLHHFKEALEALQHSIKLSPTLTESYKGMAEVYIEQGSLNKARDIIRQGIEANSDAADLYAAMSMIYLQSSDVRSAERYLRQAEALDDEDEFVQAARERFDTDKKLVSSKSQSHKGQHQKSKKKR